MYDICICNLIGVGNDVLLYMYRVGLSVGIGMGFFFVMLNQYYQNVLLVNFVVNNNNVYNDGVNQNEGNELLVN